MSWLPSREVDQTILPLSPLVKAWLVASSAASGFTGAPLGGPANTAAARDRVKHAARAVCLWANPDIILIPPESDRKYKMSRAWSAARGGPGPMPLGRGGSPGFVNLRSEVVNSRVTVA